MVNVQGLSAELQPVVDFELRRGNRIERVDRPAGTRCALAVIFALPLDIAGFQASSQMPKGVKTWQNLDGHYPLEAGYVCEITRHAIAGPLAARGV